MHKLVVIFNNRLPTEKAHGIQIAKMCEVFGEVCHTELWMPIADNYIKENIYQYYGLKNNFLIKKLYSFNLPKKIFPAGIIYRFRYFTFLADLLFVRKKNEYIFLTRHPEVVFVLTLFGCKVIFENHNWYEAKNKIRKNLFLIKKSFAIITTTKFIKNKFIEYGFSENKILLAPNGVDLNEFNVKLNYNEAKKKLELPLNKKIILYAGTLHKKKGVYTLAEAGKYLSDEFKIVIIGGSSCDVNELKKFAKDINLVKVIGYKKHQEIPLYLKAADMLVIANSAEYDSEDKYTCPLKLFEYLAANKVILASDVPSIREFVDENAVVFFKSDDPKSLAQAIMDVSCDVDKQERLLKSIKQKSQEFSWEKRGEEILKFIGIL